MIYCFVKNHLKITHILNIQKYINRLFHIIVRMTMVLQKETVNRLMRDIKQIIKNPLIDNGIYYIHDEIDILKGYALIIGPSDTPYFSGYYFFTFTYPVDYPHSPPKVTYYTNGNNIRFNPNLYKCGKVCISLLNTWSGDQWTSCQTISTVLLTLCSLLCKDPLLNEPGVSKTHKELHKYTQVIEYSNIDLAICDILNKKHDVYINFFDNFYFIIKDIFNKNYNKLIDFIDNKIIETEGKPETIDTVFYSMKLIIDYQKLKQKLIETNKTITI